MSGEDVYVELFGITVFLGALWLAAFLCKLVKISPIVGQILVGIILGPNVLDFVPLFQGECEIESENSTSEEHHILFRKLQDAEEALLEAILELEGDNIWVVLGELGVALLIMESGLHVDFKTLRVVGASAFLVAVLGTFGPLLLGILFSAILGIDPFPTGLGVGAVLAPTSVGIALKLLHEANVLDSKFGQTIVTAAFTDDIFSLVTLTVLLALAAGELTAWNVIQPFLFSFLFIAFTFYLAMGPFPKLIEKILHLVTDRFGQKFRDIFHLGFMFITLGIYGLVGNYIGSHLLGAFVSGVSFTKVPRTHEIWEREMHVINTWLIAIFFGATVGFAIPVDELLNLEIFWKGLIIGIVPGIIGKVMSGMALRKRWVVGWAMVGRGEFAFLVAQTLRETPFEAEENDDGTFNNFIDDEAFAIACWALILATFVAPIAFGIVLASQTKEAVVLDTEETEPGKRKSSVIRNMQSTTSVVRRMSSVFFGNVRETTPRSEWYITIGAPHQAHLLRDIMRIFARYDISCKSFVNEGDAVTDLFTFTVLIPDGTDESDEIVADTFQKKASIMRQRTNKDFDDENPPPEREEPRNVEFRDDFFKFDMNIFLEKLKRKLLAAMNGKATVSIERSNAAVTRRALPHLERVEEETGMDSEDDTDSVEDPKRVGDELDLDEA
eukprot:augustus_masked-scaffold_24-processed-gene-3.45-mRNA-1 protein AED:1.00 eAED:1.00 QI:0/-1/0/0/-1/1/1/0/668